MSQKDVERLFGSCFLTARMLAEYRIRTMLRLAEFADLRLCMQFARPGTMAIDVGASVGRYALALRKAVSLSGSVLALEPNPAVYKKLVRTTWLAGVDTVNAAASSTNGTADLLIPVDSEGRRLEPRATLEDRGQASVRVQVLRVRLDDLLRDTTSKVSLIKIDVEGHEAEVIRGASDVLDRHRPTLVVEIESRYVGGVVAVADVVALLTKRGYRCHAIYGGTLIPWADFDVTRWQASYLAASDEYRAAHRVEYVNNFLFEPIRLVRT